MNALDVFTAARPDVDIDDDVLDAIAADVFDGHRRRGRGGVHWRVLGVAAAAAALVAGLIAVVGRPDPSGPADSVLPAVPGGSEPLAMLPSDPSLWRIMGSVREPVADPVVLWSAVIARPDGSGGYDSSVRVRRGPSDVTLVRAGLESVTVEPVGLGEGRQGELVTDQIAGRMIVQFELRDGSSVSVETAYREPLSGERARVMQIAAGIEFREEDGADFEALPDGFEIVAPWQLGRVHTARWTSFETADGDEWYTVNVVANPDPTFALRGMDAVVTPVEVRGTTGFLSTRRFPGSDDVQELTLVWQEQPGQWVRVHDVGPTHSQPDLLAFVASLRVVSVEAWDAVAEPMPGSEQGTPATTKPADEAPAPTDSLPAPGTTVPPATTAPQTAPPGTVLVGNAAQIGGLAAQQARVFELQGVDVLEPANAAWPGGVELATTRVFARPGADPLADWVAGELGVDLVEPIEALDGFVIDGDVEAADVVVVLGLDALTPGLVQDASLVIGDSVTLGAAGVLSERGYIVNADVSRQLVDMVPVMTDLVSAVDPNILVIQLGTNGPFDAADLDALLDVVSDVPNVVVVNVHADRSWAATNNVLIADRDHPGDNVIVLDWDAFAAQCPGECFVSDGIHLTETGAEFFADRLGDITGY